ncbi:MAG: hypothetical protein L0Y55_01290, partial [Anaerolineales bacterium]|nr:hypothetical protein [Anaerolineales bacterium]
LAVFFTLLFFAQPLATSFVVALVVALIASIVEAVSPFGIDNLTVPLSSAIVLVALKMLM